MDKNERRFFLKKFFSFNLNSESSSSNSINDENQTQVKKTPIQINTSSTKKKLISNASNENSFDIIKYIDEMNSNNALAEIDRASSEKHTSNANYREKEPLLVELNELNSSQEAKNSKDAIEISESKNDRSLLDVNQISPTTTTSTISVNNNTIDKNSKETHTTAIDLNGTSNSNNNSNQKKNKNEQSLTSSPPFSLPSVKKFSSFNFSLPLRRMTSALSNSENKTGSDLINFKTPSILISNENDENQVDINNSNEKLNTKSPNKLTSTNQVKNSKEKQKLIKPLVIISTDTSFESENQIADNNTNINSAKDTLSPKPPSQNRSASLFNYTSTGLIPLPVASKLYFIRYRLDLIHRFKSRIFYGIEKNSTSKKNCYNANRFNFRN
jgi:hypothetical protein